MLYEAFDTPNRLPITRWSKIGAEVAAGDTLIAEIGSLSLEFTRLSQLTGDTKYFDAVQRINNHLAEQQMKTKLPGLFPITVNAREADFTSDSVFTIGSMADSLYEYFPKQYLLLGGLSSQCKTLYENAALAIQEFVLFKPLTLKIEDVVLAGTVRAWDSPKLELDPQMQHLSCFAGGMVALAAKIFDRPGDLKLAAQLTNGCLWAGKSTPSGIMPELFHAVPCPGGLEYDCLWDEDVWADDVFRRNTHDDKPGEKQLPKHERIKLKEERLRLPKGMSATANRQYLLRPEVIESVFVMYRITGDEIWRDEAWFLFTTITNRTRTDIAFAALQDVTSNSSGHIDKMESFWLAETLKYFYLIFSEPDVVSLDDYVFNTEAHPFKRPK
jgi:mannosyl-oligosaccharide alpha-1,2-mannosidase